jgi:signal peptidase II
MTPRAVGISCGVAALALDQGSKALILYGLHFMALGPAARIDVFPFFDIVMVWNPGISYGLFPAHGPLGTAVLAVFSSAAVLGLGWWLWRAARRVLAAGLGLVIGGAIGNLIDRLIYTKVADFFHFYVQGFNWYVFNIADCAITVGVVALLYDALLRREPATGETSG